MRDFSTDLKSWLVSGVNRLAFMLCLALLAIPVEAIACSCWHPSPDAYLSAAQLIFRGTVVSVNPASTRPIDSTGTAGVTFRGPWHGMRARFQVLESYKGPVESEMDVGYTASDGANCGWRFSVGQVVTVFATGNRKAGYSTGMCMMIPYGSYTGGGDKRYSVAIEQYRARRTKLSEEVRNSGSEVQALREQAAFFSEYKDLDEAEESFNRLLQLRPSDAAALLGRGDVKYAAARFDEALSDYRAAIVSEPANAKARRGRTLSLVKLNKSQELSSDDRDFTGFDSGYDQRISFAGADLVLANFRGTMLNGVDFSSTDLSGADFSGASMHTSNFSGARLTGAKFENVKFAYNTAFHRAALQYSNFKGANLFHTNLEGAMLDNADFSRAQMESASLRNASIAGANFQEASFLLTTLTGACYDTKTRWPAGFDPVAAGARICQ